MTMFETKCKATWLLFFVWCSSFTLSLHVPTPDKTGSASSLGSSTLSGGLGYYVDNQNGGELRWAPVGAVVGGLAGYIGGTGASKRGYGPWQKKVVDEGEGEDKKKPLLLTGAKVLFVKFTLGDDVDLNQFKSIVEEASMLSIREQGCLMYDVLQDMDDPAGRTFAFAEAYTDEDHFRNHLNKNLENSGFKVWADFKDLLGNSFKPARFTIKTKPIDYRLGRSPTTTPPKHARLVTYRLKGVGEEAVHNEDDELGAGSDIDREQKLSELAGELANIKRADSEIWRSDFYVDPDGDNFNQQLRYYEVGNDLHQRELPALPHGVVHHHHGHTVENYKVLFYRTKFES